MPGREHGFYSVWRALAPTDRTLPRTLRTRLRDIAERPDDSVLEALDALAIPDENRVTYLQAHLTRLPGWAAHVNWCADRDGGIDLLQYLAMRLSYEAALTENANGQIEEPVVFAPSTARDRAAHLFTVWGRVGATESDLATAARILAACGYDLMTDPDLRAAAREDFLKRRGDKPFVSALPPDRKLPLGLELRFVKTAGEEIFDTTGAAP